MRILFVRHGNPNYELDALTELGHKQADACAERLSHEGIERIFSSTCGRALETAAYTAKKIRHRGRALRFYPRDRLVGQRWQYHT